MAERIPPACRFRFERFVSQVCEAAKLDYEQRPLVAHELLTHLCERWRHWEERGLDSEASTERALVEFGSVNEVASAHRLPWLKRFLVHKRERGNRRVFFLLVSVVLTWFAVVDRFDIEIREDPFESQVIHITTFLNAPLAVLYFSIFYLPIERPWLRVLCWTRHIMIVPGVMGLLNTSYYPVLLLIQSPNWDVYSSVEILLRFVFIVLGWIATLGILSDLFRYPEKYARRHTAPLTLGKT